MNILFPDKPILEIIFLKIQERYKLTVNKKEFEIIGKDEMLDTVLVGTDKKGRVFSLETDDKTIIYIAGNTEAFVNELLLYHSLSEDNGGLSENPSDMELKRFVKSFKKKIKKFDRKAFYSRMTFWSLVCEEMEYGII